VFLLFSPLPRPVTAGRERVQLSLKRAHARALLTALVICKSDLDRSLTLLLQQRSRKKQMATLNEHTFVLAAIFSD